MVYASVSQLGDLSLKKEGGVYQVKTKPKDVGMKTRSIKIKEIEEGKSQQASDFFEDKVTVKTGK